MNKVHANENQAVSRAAREAFWRDVWQRRGWRSYALSPFAYLFHIIGRVRRALYRTGFLEMRAAPIPVIVVGGIMIGGVGKTPVVVSLALALKKAGFHPAIISRGYTLDKVQSNLPPREVTGQSMPADVGDEPVLIGFKTGFPVWVGRQRVEVADMLCQAHPECDVIICDDGLQHYALARDIEIVVMDERGVGNGWCLPAGPLREAKERLDEADAVIWHHRCKDDAEVVRRKAEVLRHEKPHHFEFYSFLSDAYDLQNPTYRLPLSYFAGKCTLAMAGIAQPEVFFDMLKAQNIHGATLPLPDHFEFDAHFALRDVIKRAQYVLMTEKDAVKFKHIIANMDNQQQKFWVVPLEVIHNAALKELSEFLVRRLEKMLPKLNDDEENNDE